MVPRMATSPAMHRHLSSMAWVTSRSDIACCCRRFSSYLQCKCVAGLTLGTSEVLAPAAASYLKTAETSACKMSITHLQGDVKLDVWSEVIQPFNLMPRFVLEGTSNAVMNALVTGLLPKFMDR